MSKLQGKVRGDTEWSDIDDMGSPQARITEILAKMKSHGFRVKETDHGWTITNPLTKKVECEYRIW